MALGQGTILVLLMGLGSRLRPQPAAGDEWSYSGPEGEDHWASHFPHCGTTLQSPIDFHSGIFTYNPALEPIQLLGYNLSTTQRLSLTNDGHAVKVTLPPTMHIISMSHRYTAVQLHLHWGSETEPVGSEHTISGVHYPSELHIVHYNSEKYENISMAQDKADGLAVIGILLEIGPFNAAYDQIFKHLKDIQYKGRLDKYFRYNGSLTTPPCYPSVQWTVLKEPVQISSEQLLPVPTFCWGWTHMFTRGRLEKCADVISFKLLELESDLYYSNKGEGNGTEMVDNYRHVQDLGTRAVFISFQEAVNAGQSLSPGVILIIAICCLFGVAIVVAMTIFFLKKRARKTEDGGMVYKAASAADTPAQA